MSFFIIKGLTIGSNTSLAAKGVLANRLQRRTACKIQNGRQGAPKWQRGSGKVSTPRFLGVPVNFCKISFLIRALLLWEKVATEKKTGEKNGKKKTDENSGHYVIATRSRQNENRVYRQSWGVIFWRPPSPLDFQVVEAMAPCSDFVSFRMMTEKNKTKPMKDYNL